jgi:hypothetical protein
VAFADEPLDGLLGQALLVDALGLPEERRTEDVAPQRSDASARTFRSVIVFLAPPLRRAKGTGGSANFSAVYRLEQARMLTCREY